MIRYAVDRRCRLMYTKCMSTLQTLSDTQRTFFEQATRALFANPYHPERQNLLRACMGNEPGAGSETALLQRVRAELGELDKNRPATLSQFAGTDQQLLGHAFLFDVFHEFCEAFDALIGRDAGSSGASDFPEAPDLLATLARRGFSTSAACGYVGLLYQFRRARHFIDQDVLGEAEAIQTVRRELWDVIFSHDMYLYERYLWNRMNRFSALLQGESGTGKAAAARVIGRSAFIPYNPDKRRFVRPLSESLISVDVASWPPERIESHLFGIQGDGEEGGSHEGVCAACGPHSVLFIEKIADCPGHVQQRLAHVLKHRCYTPVNGLDSLRFHGRIIASAPLAPEGGEPRNALHPDLYHQLCAAVITLPSLRVCFRENPQERTRMVRHMLTRLLGACPEDCLERVMDQLDTAPGPAYSWPGNVPELGQAVRRILLAGHYDGESEPWVETKDPGRALYRQMEAGVLTATDLQARYCTLLYEQYGTFGEVARRTDLNWRTVKKYIEKERGYE